MVASTVWSSNCPDDDQNIRLVKLDSSLNVEWSEEYGECNGSDQLFDFVVDRLEKLLSLGLVETKSLPTMWFLQNGRKNLNRLGR